MHELGITQEIIAIASHHAEGRKILRVVLEIGKLSAIEPDAIRFCFDVCCEGTLAEGAELEIIEIPAQARCRQCNHSSTLETFWEQCQCGGIDWEITAGEELRIKEMELL